MHIIERTILTNLVAHQSLAASRFHTEQTRVFTDQLTEHLDKLLVTPEAQRALAWLQECGYVTEYNIPTEKGVNEANDIREVGNRGLTTKLYNTLNYASNKLLYNRPTSVLDKAVEFMDEPLFTKLLESVLTVAEQRFRTQEVNSKVYDLVSSIHQNQSVIVEELITAEANMVEIPVEAAVEVEAKSKKKAKA